VTRTIVLAAMAVFVAFFIVGFVPSRLASGLASWLALEPWLALRRMPWQLLTYAFLPMGLLGSGFAWFSIWVFGAQLEDERGSRWYGEYFLATTIGGALSASLISLVLGDRVPQLGPHSVTAGLWPAVLAIMLAFARSNPDAQVRIYMVIPIKIKYLVMAYLLVYLLMTLFGDQFSAMTALCTAGVGFLHLRYAPRRGLKYAGTEWWFGLRNAYYRSRRRQAAKKFTVYMRKQGKDVSIDDSGRYMDPSGKPRDPNDKRWMN
jgi:membrane associated rhomboid family serine protease